MDKLTWELYEYPEKNKNTDWFWALGIIIIAGATTAFIYQNYFFSIVIVLAGILVGFFANKKPDLVSYELNAEGLQIKNRIFPYKDIEGFNINTDKRPTLFIKTKRFIFPVISVPIEYTNKDEIKNIFLFKEIKEEEIKETIPEKIMEYFDF